jgi:acetamidase/formamidase
LIGSAEWTFVEPNIEIVQQPSKAKAARGSDRNFMAELSSRKPLSIPYELIQMAPENIMSSDYPHRPFVSPLCLLAAAMSLSAIASAQAVHSLMPSPQTVHIGNFNAALKPVLTVNSGDIVMLESAGAIDPATIDKSGVVPPSAVPEYLRTIYREFKDRGPGPGGHVLTGPIEVRGAEPGDVLEIRMLEVNLAVAYGYNVQRPGSGALPDEFTALRERIIPIDLQTKTATVAPGVVVPVSRPFFGVAGVAPPAALGRVSSAPPGTHAGNLDNKDLVAGSILYVPVHVRGALFSAGDGHAAQGHGEVNLTALETGLRGKFQLIVRKDLKLKWPRAETPTHWLVMGLDPSLEEAMKIAVRETIDLITARFPRLTREDAYMIASVEVDYHVTQVVDGTKGIHGMIPKAIFQK